MKKIRKIGLASLIIVLMGMFALVNNIPETLHKEEVSSYAQAYTHNPENILDNVFESDGLTILPIIFENAEQTIEKKYVVEQFTKAGLTIENETSLKDVLVTGNEIKTNSKTYTLLVYGDVNKDGEVDVIDADFVFRHYFGEEGYTLAGIYETAGNVYNEDSEADVIDAQRIFEFYLGLEKKLVLHEPDAFIETDEEAPVISVKGDNPQIIKLGEPYVELGATATDNVDKNVIVKSNASEVIALDSAGNTTEIKDYVVTYTAEDASGNKAEPKERIVKVVDYIKEINIKDLASNLEYRYADTIESAIANAKIQFINASGTIAEEIPVQATMLSTLKAEVAGVQTITVTCTKDGQTFTTNFNITVIPRKVTVSQLAMSGYCYDEIEVGNVVSDVPLTAADFEILKDGKPLENADVAKITVGSRGTIVFEAIESGNYTITPTGNITGDSLKNIVIIHNPRVDGITLGDLEKPQTVVNVREKGTPAIIPIYFIHDYGHGNIKEMEDGVEANRLTVTPTPTLTQNLDPNANVQILLLDVNGDTIEDPTTATTKVKQIYVKGLKEIATPITLTIAVDSESTSAKINVLEEAKPELKVDTTGPATLYLEAPANPDNMTEVPQTSERAVAFRLLQVHSEIDGVRDILFGSQINTDKVKFKIIDKNNQSIISEDACANNILAMKKYDKDKNPTTSDSAEIGFIGIGIHKRAITNQDQIEALRANGITIFYEGKEVMHLDITVPEKTLSTITTSISEPKANNYCYDEIKLEVKSGVNEEKITANDTLTWKITRDDGADSVAEAIASISPIQVTQNGIVEVKFKATKKGKYTITPTLTKASKSTITGNALEIIVENPTIDSISLGETTSINKIEVKQGSSQTIPIHFRNNGISEAIDAEAKKLTIQPEPKSSSDTSLDTEDVRIMLLDEGKDTIENPTTSNTDVKYIYVQGLKQTQAGVTVTLSIRVDGKEKLSLPITVLEPAKPDLKIDTVGPVKLYLTAPSSSDDMTEVPTTSERALAFSLLQIHAEIEGVTDEFLGSQITTDSVKFKIIDKNDKSNIISEDACTDNILVMKKYDKDKNPTTSDSAEIEYIGVGIHRKAITNQTQVDALKENGITVFYGTKEVAHFDVSILP